MRLRRVSTWVMGSACVLLAVAGCGDDGSSPSGAGGEGGTSSETTATSSSPATTTSSTGSGLGGMTTSASSSSVGGHGGAGGAGAAGGAGGEGGGGGAGGATSSAGGAGGAGGATSSAGGAGGAGGTSSSMASSSSASSSSGAGGASPVCGARGTPSIVSAGTSQNLLLRGTIVLPTGVIEGEVLVVGGVIACADVSCAASAGASTARVVDTQGIVMPGLIDTHNHILFDIFDESDWTPTMAYQNHNQWTNEARYGALVDAKQYLNGEGSSVDYGCEMEKYGEVKGLIAGTTSIVGAANPANRACYGSLSRTIDQTPNGGLGPDKIQVATLFPSTTSADGVCANFASGKTDAYVIHIAEGVDQTSRNEFTKLGTITTTDGCLYSPKTTIVHGTSLQDAELSIMAQHQMNLVWSPRSNVFLYGSGTDLTKTANIPLALQKGITVALAPDWSIGGSHDLLDELRFADKVDNTVWGDVITPQMLFEMVTKNAAHAIGLSAVLGTIEVGKKADLMVFAGDRCAPFDALLATHPEDVRLVTVGGVALYGDAELKPLGPATPGCEDLSVCTASKFVCVAATSSTSTDKLAQTFASIQTILGDASAAYDDLNLSAYNFGPITPIVDCH